MLDFIKKLFIWWEGPTFGTMLDTWLHGVRVGEDGEGNVYYRSKKGDRRWVVYNGEVEATRIPPEWHRWLHKTADKPPTEEPLPLQKWEKPHKPNVTGTPEAYFPEGSPHAKGVRPKADGDYEPWIPGKVPTKS